MSFAHSPKIVTDGLVLALDAGNTKSYVSGSTTWFDKSGFSNNGTLINGPTFSSANLGSIVFDGTNDYVLVNSGSTSINPTVGITVTSVFNVSSFGSNYAPIVFKQNNYASTYEQYSLGFFSNAPFLVITGVDRTQKVLQATGNYTNQTIYVAGTCDIVTDEMKLYINGTLMLTGSFTSTFDVADTPINIGGTGVLKFGAGFAGFTNGKIFNAQIYSRALPPSEITQNFNALRGRFGI
jgi:hypothetical protein